jgi:glucose-1-phosphate cytidylyltransferase
MEVHQQKAEPWRVTLVDTGDDTMTGGRLKRVAEYLRRRGPSASPMATASATSTSAPRSTSTAATASWPRSPRSSRRAASARSTSAPARQVIRASPRSRAATAAWINGGFFVLEPKVIDLIDGDQTTSGSGSR